MPKNARPTFLIIGAMKCGTTSLHYYLGQHPQIQMPTMKETNFFAPPEGIPYSPGTKWIKSLDEYERLFDSAFEVRGEASPSYTVYPRYKGVPERIKDIVPDAKFIYLVRDPVARAVSQYHFRVAAEGERRSLQEALDDLSDPLSLYTSPGFYAAQLSRYLQHFSQDRVLVVDHTSLLADRQTTLREIFAFLSVDDSFVSPRFDEEINTGKELRTYSDVVILFQRARASPLQRLPRRLRVSLRRAVERIVSKPLIAPTLDDDLRGRLQELYADDAKHLRELTGQTFPTWSV